MKNTVLKRIADGFLAGIMITIGGTVLLSCENRYVGAALFTIALLVICLRGFSLYTGKIGFIAASHTKRDFSVIFLGLLGNAVGTVLFGCAVRYSLSSLCQRAFEMCSLKLALDLPVAFIRAAFCGILMYIAVEIYKDNKSIVGILFCVPVFILCGFEHSIADMFYFAAAGIYTFESFLFILTVVIGNSLGALLVPMLLKIRERS